VLLYTEGLGGAPTSDAEHRQLLNLCREKDADGAESVLRDHLLEAAQSVRDYLSR
jgi:DNA-binding FadR family transcriptional regulator